MAQEFLDEQNQKREMEKVINLLKRYNIDFTVDGDKVLIMGNMKYVDIRSFSTITIWQGNNVISFDKLINDDRLVIKTSTRSRPEVISIPKSVHAYYEYQFLVLQF